MAQPRPLHRPRAAESGAGGFDEIKNAAAELSRKVQIVSRPPDQNPDLKAIRCIAVRVLRPLYWCSNDVATRSSARGYAGGPIVAQRSASRADACPSCGREILYERFHAGFSNEGFAYCDNDSTVLLWETFAPWYTAIVKKHPWMLNDEERRRVEAMFPRCQCGGRFAFTNPPLCPHCRSDISSFVPAGIYFLVIGSPLRYDDGKPI